MKSRPATSIREANAREGADIVDRATRSRMMRAVGQRDTSAELMLRGIVTALGIRYRVCNKDLKGSPDLANRSKRWAIFVNGCFWHGHKNCVKTKSVAGSRVPKQSSAYWSKKFVDNRARDAKCCRELRRRKYRVMIIWECELRKRAALTERLQRFFQ